MRIGLGRATALAVTATAMLTGAAAAQGRQGVEIVYAGQGQGQGALRTASLDQRLAGGSETSYGYGAGAAREERAAVIDLRRASNRADTASAEEGAAPWLERERVGPPYEANGRWYTPTPEPGYEMTGQASWYGPTFHGRATASGETFDQEALTAAHPTLPIPSLVQVTNLDNGREIIVRVNDRGPFIGDRLIDLSHGAAQVLGFVEAGQARVHVRYLGPAPRHVLDSAEAADAPPAPRPEALNTEVNAYAAGVSDGPVSLLPPAAEGWRAPAPSPAPVYEAALSTPPPAPAPMVGGYFVQVGAFSDLMNAHRVRAAVETAGPVAVDARQTARGELFRVRLGPWTSREEAEAARRSLANLGFPEAILAAR